MAEGLLLPPGVQRRPVRVKEPTAVRGWSCWECGKVWGRINPGCWVPVVLSELDPDCRHTTMHATHLSADDIPDG